MQIFRSVKSMKEEEKVSSMTVKKKKKKIDMGDEVKDKDKVFLKTV